MKRLIRKSKHLTDLLVVLAASAVLFACGFHATAIALAGCWQLFQFAKSRRCGVAFTTVLTPEQLKEFDGIMADIKQHTSLFPQLKDLASVEGGFAAIKALPAMLKLQGEANTTLRADLDALKKARKGRNEVTLRQPGRVSDDCARTIASIVILQAEMIGVFEKQGYDSHRRDALTGVARDALGITGKAALTTSDIPMPTEFSGDIVELVSQFGAARKFGTVYPLGNGIVKLPQLGTDPTFGLIAASATVTEKSPTITFVTFTAEKFGGLVRIPSEIDADTIVPLGQFLARYCARQIASVEDHNFFRSTGAASGINGTVKGLTESTITNSKVTQMATGKTAYSDSTLANIRAIRSKVDAPVIGMGAYYMHPTFEQHLAGLNTAGDKPYQANGLGGATLDGFPIRWVDIMPAYSTSANVSKVFMLFGDATYQYLGVRAGIGLDTSKDVFFATDELAVRCLERFTIGLMATGAVSGLQTAAS